VGIEKRRQRTNVVHQWVSSACGLCSVHALLSQPTYRSTKLNSHITAEVTVQCCLWLCASVAFDEVGLIDTADGWLMAEPDRSDNLTSISQIGFQFRSTVILADSESVPRLVHSVLLMILLAATQQ